MYRTGLVLVVLLATRKRGLGYGRAVIKGSPSRGVNCHEKCPGLSTERGGVYSLSFPPPPLPRLERRKQDTCEEEESALAGPVSALLIVSGNSRKTSRVRVVPCLSPLLLPSRLPDTQAMVRVEGRLSSTATATSEDSGHDGGCVCMP